MKKLSAALTAFLLLFSSICLAGKPILGFIENKGQEKGPVLFKVAGSDQNVYITTEGLTYVFSGSRKKIDHEVADAHPAVEFSKLEMKLQGANIRKENISAENALPGYSNYYYPHCSDGILFVRTWQKVTIASVYPGIDWVLQISDKGMEHDFIVHPNADPSMIKLVYNGAGSLEAQANSSRLKVTTAHGTLFEGDLKTYRQQSGAIVNSKFKIKDNTVTFALGKHKFDETIVIDPPLMWTAPQSSSGVAQAYAVSAARDNSRDVVIAGYTDASGYPTLNAYQGTFVADEDMVITRLNPNGTVLWSTYYGGNNFDAAKGVATDNSGNVYVAGHTNSFDFPMLNNAQVQYANGYEVGIMKFNSAGVRQWATLYGATGNDYGMAIEVDNSGNAYITGYTNSTGFPVVNAVQPTKNNANDALIMKMSTTGTVIWATYYGGDDDDKGRGVALDSAGAYLHITGSSISGTFPTTAGVFQQYSASGYYADDAFIMKMDASSQAVQWAAYTGGTDYDFGQDVAVDNNGNVYITGYTLSADLPVTSSGNNSYIDSTLGSPGTHDAFVMMCSSTGTQRIWSTYFGGGGTDLATSIEYSPAGIYITGRTASTDLPVLPPADIMYFQGTQGDAGTMNDMFIAQFSSPQNLLLWSTYYGDTDNEEGYSVDTDVFGNIYIAGSDANDAQAIKFGDNSDTGINEYENSQVDIYPHPVNDILNTTINGTGVERVIVTIIDMQGQAVRSISSAVTDGENELRINVDGIATGVYLLEIQHDKGILRKKFVKQ